MQNSLGGLARARRRAHEHARRSSARVSGEQAADEARLLAAKVGEFTMVIAASGSSDESASECGRRSVVGLAVSENEQVHGAVLRAFVD